MCAINDNGDVVRQSVRRRDTVEGSDERVQDQEEEVRGEDATLCDAVLTDFGARVTAQVCYGGG